MATGEAPAKCLFFFKTADYSAFTDGIKVRLNPGADQTQFLTEFEPPNPLRTKQ